MRETNNFRGPYVKPDSVRFPVEPRVLMPAMPSLKLMAVFEFWGKVVTRRHHFRRLFLPLLNESDDLLDDIGYRKEEILWALRLPLKVDALRALEACRKERLADSGVV